MAYTVTHGYNSCNLCPPITNWIKQYVRNVPIPVIHTSVYKLANYGLCIILETDRSWSEEQNQVTHTPPIGGAVTTVWGNLSWSEPLCGCSIRSGLRTARALW